MSNEPIKEIEDDEDECMHDEHDHGICIDCGKDISDYLICRAERAAEGDR